MPLLYPQIDRIEARRCVQDFQARATQPFVPSFSNPRQTYSPVGGSRAQEHVLRKLREDVEDTARAAGWPAEAGSEARRRFDRSLARLLHEQLAISTHEAAKPGVWQFLCCVLCPDIVAWRFSRATEQAVEARYFGGNRNAFGRLWWRAEVLQDIQQGDPYHLLDALGEDELVQVMERPSIVRSRPLAKALAKGFVAVYLARDRRAEVLGRMDLMRDAAKRVLRMGAIIAYDVLDEDQAGAIAKIELARACEALMDGRAVTRPDRRPVAGPAD